MKVSNRHLIVANGALVDALFLHVKRCSLQTKGLKMSASPLEQYLFVYFTVCSDMAYNTDKSKKSRKKQRNWGKQKEVRTQDGSPFEKC